jgi:hypothetical protein
VLDLLVHRTEMPLAGNTSMLLGFGLWQHISVALGVEALLVVAGIFFYLSGNALTRARSIAVAVFGLALMLFTSIGMTIAPPPPSAHAMAASSLVTIVLVCAIFWWLGKSSRPRGGLPRAASSRQRRAHRRKFVGA